MDAYVYIMTNQRNGTLYTGVTSKLVQRIWQHKTGTFAGFTSEHKLHDLVYYEVHSTIMHAIEREKNIKAWKRQWKLNLIETKNPHWNDLYEEII
jgi:putative endonuclease